MSEIKHDQKILTDMPWPPEESPREKRDVLFTPTSYKKPITEIVLEYTAMLFLIILSASFIVFLILVWFLCKWWWQYNFGF